MKRVRCPKCDNFIVFDETQYPEGQSLCFVCDACHREFTIRIGVSKLRALQRDENRASEEAVGNWGSIVVLENGFGYKQQLPLHEGDNLIGRRNKGTVVDVPIETNDPSLDRCHCYINVRRLPDGTISYTLRDNHSNVGTVLMNEMLGDKERIPITDGAVVTLGATTFILRGADD